MQEIEGYILVGAFKNYVGKALHGPNIGNGTGATESFKSNGMKPFETLEEARQAMSDFKKRPGVLSVLPRHLEMAVADNLEEMEQFRNKKRLITIMSLEDKWVEFFGTFVPGAVRVGYLPGSLLETNGLRPFTSYERALRSIEEIVRQARSSAKMSTFNLRTQPRK